MNVFYGLALALVRWDGVAYMQKLIFQNCLPWRIGLHLSNVGCFMLQSAAAECRDPSYSQIHGAWQDWVLLGTWQIWVSFAACTLQVSFASLKQKVDLFLQSKRDISTLTLVVRYEHRWGMNPLRLLHCSEELGVQEMKSAESCQDHSANKVIKMKYEFNM